MFQRELLSAIAVGVWWRRRWWMCALVALVAGAIGLTVPLAMAMTSAVPLATAVGVGFAFAIVPAALLAGFFRR